MSIADLQKVNNLKLENLKRKHHRDTQMIETAHEEHKTDLKKSHEVQMVDLQQEHLRQIASDTDKKEKVLSSMKKQVEETKKLTDRELVALKNQNQLERQKESERLAIERERKINDHEIQMQDLNYRFTKSQQNINHEHQMKVSSLNDIKMEELATKGQLYEQKLKDQSDKFRQSFNRDDRLFRELKEDQEEKFKIERSQRNLRQQGELEKQALTHQKSYKLQDKEFRKAMNEQNLMFEKKYAGNLSERNAELQRLSDMNTKVESKLKSDLSEKIESIVKKSDDPFYRFTELKPTLKTTQEGVEISVPIPEYSKSDVMLTVHEKEAILNFNRRYTDSRADGNMQNKLSKVETFSTRIKTEYILDPKNISSSYEDGVMTYKIKRV